VRRPSLLRKEGEEKKKKQINLNVSPSLRSREGAGGESTRDAAMTAMFQMLKFPMPHTSLMPLCGEHKKACALQSNVQA
jgi:hypothetical protein